MVIKTQKIEAHWNYLLAIEGDLERVSRYVEFDRRNFECFSIEISKILMTSAAEVDVVCQQICKRLDQKSSADSINDYRREIKAEYPAIPEFGVLIPRFGLTLNPWINWKSKGGVPDWWTASNKIKHQRYSEFYQGNLQNAINSVAGLFIMMLYLYKDKAQLGELVPSPTLLRVTNEHYGGTTMGDYEMGTNYLL